MIVPESSPWGNQLKRKIYARRKYIFIYKIRVTLRFENGK